MAYSHMSFCAWFLHISPKHCSLCKQGKVKQCTDIPSNQSVIYHQWKSHPSICSDTSPAKILLGKAQARKKKGQKRCFCYAAGIVCLLFMLLFFFPLDVFCRCVCLGKFFVHQFFSCIMCLWKQLMGWKQTKIFKAWAQGSNNSACTFFFNGVI